MAHLKKKKLDSDFSSTLLGGVQYKETATPIYNNLVDSLYSTEVVSENTVSESHEVTLQVIQPANSIIEDVVVVCTSDASLDSGVIGLKVGTGGTDSEQIVAANNTALLGSAGTSLDAGKGTSTVDTFRTALGGGALIALVADSPFTDSERTVTATVSASADFDTDTGEFTLALKYLQLK